MSIVEVDRALKVSACDRHADARLEVGGDVTFEIVEQDEELAVRWGKTKPWVSRSIIIAPASFSAWKEASIASKTGCGVGTFGSNPFSPARVIPILAPFSPFGFTNCV